MSTPYTNGMETITQAEHISPAKTGDNIDAKRVALYAWDGTNWQRQGLSLTPNKDYDYIDGQETSSTVETYEYRLGGAGGTLVQTIVVTYTTADKDFVNNVSYS